MKPGNYSSLYSAVSRSVVPLIFGELLVLLSAFTVLSAVLGTFICVSEVASVRNTSSISSSLSTCVLEAPKWTGTSYVVVGSCSCTVSCP